MNPEKKLPKTKAQMANELGISLRTFQRRLVQHNLNIPRGLIMPQKQILILIELGYSSQK